jgi:hypothetical protein
MGKHLRKRFSVNEVKKVFERYLSQEITVEHALAMRKIRRRQFLLKIHRERPESFSFQQCTFKIFPTAKIVA